LKDINFSVEQGEVLGIIGPNGAGKSTLLKILSRVTAPTSGHVKVKGRIASLLEVGTGFHPDLTGRENTFLNGAILGMTRTEINRKFDEIVEFSGVEKFIDTPVKRYSSGMYVRLDFAVAAHLEPEILVVDEVLAVGDAAFQKKCLGKMGDVAEEGRTVLFVSHNMRAVKTLCSRAILLENGTPVIDDHPEVVIAHYLSSNIIDQGAIEWEKNIAPKTSEIILRAIRIMDKDGKLISNPSTSDPIDVEIEYELMTAVRGLRVALSLLTEDGIAVLSSSDRLVSADSRPPGSYVSRCRIPGDLLNIGAYVVSVGIDIPTYKVLLPEREYLRFIITELMNNPMGLGSQPPVGMINPKLDWEVEMR
jgi:lipopolysaccharide transport system ATP-binding protein